LRAWVFWTLVLTFAGCGGDVRFERPGQYLESKPEAPPERRFREESFQWRKPSGEALFYWVLPGRARARELYDGLRFAARSFEQRVNDVWGPGLRAWLTCVGGCAHSEVFSGDRLLETLRRSELLTHGGPDFGRPVLDSVRRFPGVRSQRWLHVFVADVADLKMSQPPQPDDLKRYLMGLDEMAKDIGRVEGASSARVQYTLAYYPEGRGRDRCPRLDNWEGHYWSQLSAGAEGIFRFTQDIDVCDLLQGRESVPERLVADALNFQSRLIVARPVADVASMRVAIAGHPIRREDFSYDPAAQEVRLHESVVGGLSVGTPVQVFYEEELRP
jgi:hypothetical protein